MTHYNCTAQCCSANAIRCRLHLAERERIAGSTLQQCQPAALLYDWTLSPAALQAMLGAASSALPYDWTAMPRRGSSSSSAVGLTGISRELVCTLLAANSASPELVFVRRLLGHIAPVALAIELTSASVTHALTLLLRYLLTCQTAYCDLHGEVLLISAVIGQAMRARGEHKSKLRQKLVLAAYCRVFARNEEQSKGAVDATFIQRALERERQVWEALRFDVYVPDLLSMTSPAQASPLPSHHQLFLDIELQLRLSNVWCMHVTVSQPGLHLLLPVSVITLSLALVGALVLLTLELEGRSGSQLVSAAGPILERYSALAEQLGESKALLAYSLGALVATILNDASLLGKW